MIDGNFLRFYNDMKILKRQHCALKERENECIQEGIKRGYIKRATDGVYSAVEQCEEGLNKELEVLLKNRDYAKASELLKYLARENRSIVKNRNENKPHDINAENKELIENGYKTELPVEIYADSKNFSGLIENSRKYRNEFNESGKLTWKRIVDRVGISMSYVEMIRKKGKIPSHRVILNFAKVFGADPEKFLEISKNDG